MEEGKKQRRSSHQTQWAAQFAVASELCKKGYEVALTMGNHPTADIMAYSPGGRAFVVDVKGLYKRNFWAVKPKPEREDAFYVFALVPNDAGNRFFVLTQSQVNAGIAKEHAKAAEAAAARGTTNWVDRFPGIAWAYAAEYENGWDQLPA